MILDLDKFIAKEQPYWDELSALLQNYDESGDYQQPLEEAKRFYYLYQRTSADLVKLNTFAGEVETTRYIERIVAKAYSRLHESGAGKVPFRPLQWLRRTFPATVRRHWRAFIISSGAFLVGASLGVGALAVDYDQKNQFIPPQFPHLREKPSKRVEREEKQDFDAFQGRHAFSSQLMTHNAKVTALAMVSGFLWGIFTLAIILDNGKLLGLVSYDYLLDGQGEFLTAWLLPHGSVEIPAILLGGQAGLVIAHTMFGWGTNLRLRQRFARVRGDLLTLIAGASLMLIWAGIVESFLSQYHAPNFYPWKIGFGALQLTSLILYLALSGRKKSQTRLVA